MNIKLVEDFKNDTEIKINEEWQSLPVETISALSVMNFLRKREKLINEQIEREKDEAVESVLKEIEQSFHPPLDEGELSLDSIRERYKNNTLGITPKDTGKEQP